MLTLFSIPDNTPASFQSPSGDSFMLTESVGRKVKKGSVSIP